MSVLWGSDSNLQEPRYDDDEVLARVAKGKAPKGTWPEPADEIAEAEARGARREREASQPVMTGMCAALTISAIANFCQWIWR